MNWAWLDEAADDASGYVGYRPGALEDGISLGMGHYHAGGVQLGSRQVDLR
jgi:hypothetical protein